MALKLFIDNWRWAGVPFYLRTGKRLPKRASEVAIQFKDVPQVLFNAHPDVPLEPTVLSLRVQPEEGLSMRIASKLPGPKVRIYPGEDGVQLSSSVRRHDAGGLRAADARRDGRRRHAVHAPRRASRRPGNSSCRSSITGSSMRVRDLPEYQCGTWGPVEADRIIDAGRPAVENTLMQNEECRMKNAE